MHWDLLPLVQMDVSPTVRWDRSRVFPKAGRLCSRSHLSCCNRSLHSHLLRRAPEKELASLDFAWEASNHCSKDTENRLPLKTKPSKWIPQLCLKYWKFTVLVHHWHEKNTEYFNKMSSIHLFWCKYIGHHPSFAMSNERGQAMNVRKKPSKDWRADAVMWGLELAWAHPAVYRLQRRQSSPPTRLQYICNWSLSAHVLNVLSPHYYKHFRKWTISTSSNHIFSLTVILFFLLQFSNKQSIMS